MAYKNIEDKRAYDNAYREKNRESLREKSRLYRRELKRIVLEKYGQSCQLCGYEDIRALQIDHINNNGAEERKALGGQSVSGWRFYQHLVANNLPGGYQTLCANCNMIKQLGEDF
jgi:predicted restriction endonuclease